MPTKKTSQIQTTNNVYRLYVPPTPTEAIIAHEDKLTAEAYRKQLETNYALKLPPDQVTPFIDARYGFLIAKAMLAGSVGVAEVELKRYLGGPNR